MKNSYVMQNGDWHKYKYVFVCGLQRSGTSILARNIGRLNSCTTFKDTGVLEDEGQYLQDVYPTDHECGGTGWYGFNPHAHLTEASPLLTPENIARLEASWQRYWDPAMPIRIEKTPNNLLMTRFLQAAFPNSYFIVIKRHPVPVSMANQRWKKSMASLRIGFEHWLQCYGLYEQDKKHIRRLYELRYEDYINDPSRHHAEIARFIGTEFKKDEMEEISDVHNRKYFDRWHCLLTNSLFKDYYRYIARKYEPRLAPYDYSLTKLPGTTDEIVPESEPSSILGKIYSRGADLHAFGWRLLTRTKGGSRRLLRRVLPTPVKQRIKLYLGQSADEPGKHGAV
jgi:hypothetical protein